MPAKRPHGLVSGLSRGSQKRFPLLLRPSTQSRLHSHRVRARMLAIPCPRAASRRGRESRCPVTNARQRAPVTDTSDSATEEDMQLQRRSGSRIDRPAFPRLRRLDERAVGLTEKQAVDSSGPNHVKGPAHGRVQGQQVPEPEARGPLRASSTDSSSTSLTSRAW